jgi:hypothetical protein
MKLDPDPGTGEPCLLVRVRDAIRGHDLIEWSAGDFEPFRAQFTAIPLQDGSVARMRDGAIYHATLPDMVRLHARRRTAHVLLAHLNENWGAFSTPVPGRTVDWGSWHSHLAAAGCTPQMVRDYLDDPAVKAVVTPQHTVFAHRAILTLPIGLRHLRELVDVVARSDGAKTQDLLLNNSGWRHRQQINERVAANFGGRIDNSYGMRQSEYFEAVARARFVLCPSGLGWDSYRIWETLLLGAVPIVEHSEGWHRVLDDLPALTVARFDDVTPGLLARAWPDILSRCDGFDYGKLTTRWWVSRINGLLGAPAPPR